MKQIIFLFSFLLISNVEASPIEIPRTDGSMIRFYFEKPPVPSFPILIVLQGSTCISSWPIAQMVAAAIGRNIGVVAIEKYGLNENTTDCPQVYLDNNTIDERIQDHLEVLAYLRANETGWNKVLGWAGASEGGQVAALTAPLVPETKMIAMLASGGGLTMAEELPIATTRALERTGATSQVIQQAIDDLQTHYELIKENPTSNLEWLSDGKVSRNTYKWWNSILWKKALPLLELTNVPLYIAHGTEDTSCPIESSETVATAFHTLGKQNLTFKVYQGLEHNWHDRLGVDHTQEVLRDTFSWIIQNLK